MPRRVFYSFNYERDNWRTSQVRNIGTIEGNRPANDNDWEEIKRGGEAAIKRWIDNQLIGRTCTVVLVGTETANRMWINHEIVNSWDKGLGVVGIYIHGLEDSNGRTSTKGQNPFGFITHSRSGYLLSSIVRCYDPPGWNSRERYAWISRNLSEAVEEAISIRSQN